MKIIIINYIIVEGTKQATKTTTTKYIATSVNVWRDDDEVIKVIMI